jgi:hypothetical protein
MSKTAQRFMAFFRPQKTNRKETGPRLLCPSCNEWMDNFRPARRQRTVSWLPHCVHYQCPCGAISHWLADYALFSLGYGRYRRTENNQYRPHRLNKYDLLWLCPRRNVAYFFKDRLLVALELDKLPPSTTGHYSFKVLEKGTVIQHKGECFVYDGFAFVRRGNTTHLQVDGIHCEVTYLDTKTHP